MFLVSLLGIQVRLIIFFFLFTIPDILVRFDYVQ